MYHFFIGDMELPLAPEKYALRLPKKSEVLTLADGSEMSLPRPCGLREISFEVLLPYFADAPLVRDGVQVRKPIYYMNRLAEWAQSAEPRRLIIYRTLPSGEEIFNTNMLVTLDGYQVLEMADLGFDVRVAINLREYGQRVTKKFAGKL
ncbi:MAG: hypothetical protein IJB67_07750 [Firmicutes bacterium]|nr:hypothetical protein [Bacillota bacterium]